MLDKTAMSSFYRDPFLSAIRQQSGVTESAVEGSVWQDCPGGPWFTGYETEPRWMRLKASGIEIQCIEEGLLLRTPSMVSPFTETFTRVCADHKIGADLLLRIPKVTAGDSQLDQQDRVRLGANLLRDLVKAGL